MNCGDNITPEQSEARRRNRKSTWEIIYQYAGILGIDPGPFTLRELDWMVPGRGEFEWSMTANLLAQQINMNRKKGTSPVEPDSLNLFRQREKSSKIMLSQTEAMDMLKKVFVKK